MPRFSSFASAIQRSRRVATTVVCPPSGASFSSNTLTVSTATAAIQNGTYVASSSSYGSPYPAYYGFGPSSNFWHCQYPGSPGGSTPAYTQSAYSPGPYVGGGATGTLYTTATSTTAVSGEWLQLMLPHNLQLASYTIVTRDGYPTRCPAAFSVLGSNDGVAWVIVDSRSDLASLPTSFTLATMPAFYRYFRIVFSALQSGANGVNVATYGVSFSGAGTALTAFQTLRAAKAPWGQYSAASWNSGTNSLIDLTGNGRHATTTNLTTGTAAGNGAAASVAYLAGSTTGTILWPAGSIPTTFTICSISRYTTGAGRVLSATDKNWLHGHYNGNRGIVFYTNWITTAGVTSIGVITDWLNCCATSGAVAPPDNALVDGVGVGVGNSGVGSSTLCVNNNYNGQSSDFQFSQLLVWDQALTAAEIAIVSAALTNYLATGVLQ